MRALGTPPAAAPLWNDLDNPRSRWLNVIARLAPGQTFESAKIKANELYRKSSQETLEAIPNASPEFKEKFLARELTLLPGGRGRSDLRGDVGNALKIVLALVVLLFALACANLANLFAARATRHERELTVRLALGATRGALVRRLLTEAALLSTVAVAIGTAVAFAIPRLLPDLLPTALATIPPRLSPAILAAVIAFVVIATFGCGLLPSLLATKGGIAERLRSSSGSALGGARGGRVRRVLVAVQVALSAAILVGSGLLVRTLLTLSDRDPGFDRANVLRFTIDPRLTGYELEREKTLVDRLEQELAALPGVEAVGRAEMPLLDGWVSATSLEIAGDERDDLQARQDVVSTDYFRALGIGIRKGRAFSTADVATSEPVVIVNQQFVDEYLDGKDAIGRTIQRGNDQKYTIVGVAGNVLSSDLRESPARFLWYPFAQAHDGSATSFYLRTANPDAVAAAVRRTVSALDPQLPITNLHTMATQAERSLILERSTAAIAGGLGLVAALLSAIGLYGVLGYAVDSRRRELALRAVLGADPASLGKWVIAHAAPPVAIGLAIGLGVALAGGQLLSGLLYGVAPRDPATFGDVSVGLLLVALLAAAVPAMRAIAVQPAIALRDE